MELALAERQADIAPGFFYRVLHEEDELELDRLPTPTDASGEDV